MVMTVNPGFAGQDFIESTKEKFKDLFILKKEYEFKIFDDGVCPPEKILELKKLGCEGFILETSALFNKGKSYSHLIEELSSL